MGLKKENKLTGLSVISENWELKSIGDISLSISSGKSNTKTFIGATYPIYGSTGIIGFSLKYQYSGESILVARVGANAGTVNIVNGDYCVSDNALRIQLKSGYDLLFVFYYLKYYNLNKLIFGSGQPLITGSQIKYLPILIPKKIKEQNAIAIAISNVDNLIRGLKELIDKKQSIKQGAVQRLLSGNKRLDGYNGEWINKPLLELCWYQEGPGLRNWQFTSTGIKVINVTNLVDGYIKLDRTDRFISWNEFNKMYKHFEINADDIVVASSGNSYAKVAVVRKQDLPLVMNTSVIRFKPLKSLDYNFLLLFLKSHYFKDQIDLLITGGAQPNFGPYHLNKITFKVPPTKEEQIAVSRILIDMDNEIEALKQKIAKYKLIKHGIMQNLLTGKIRLNG